ncbi:hypothetical protein HYC85_017397 [Camellia sinensis]|uniref:NADP-dependent oxidoreductase domain-containing protein n=1 Tax=Camellia sinensis TaxID=4442 RepID=A0A7J7GRK2_CAMSI|nr:hypothetical protein HYC85_017397 [Camellia sinensis]
MDSKDIKIVLIHAIKLGYRHFNCAGTLTPSYGVKRQRLEERGLDQQDYTRSNCGILLTRDCLAYAKVKPAVNQIELHPYLQCESPVNFCQKHGICVTAHTPLGGALANSLSVSDILNTAVIPMTSRIERLEENMQIFDFELAKEDMDLIKSIDRKHRANRLAKTWGIDIYE